ncbi:hypothetical protein ACIO3O_00080 [Streptomyces sp. NPDC087440]|uniref:hypothetical protein n=1 Tax=Streptomyces sp. NPDC087440 TaxID=3365790 RepID=UPI00381887A4
MNTSAAVELLDLPRSAGLAAARDAIADPETAPAAGEGPHVRYFSRSVARVAGAVGSPRAATSRFVPSVSGTPHAAENAVRSCPATRLVRTAGFP